MLAQDPSERRGGEGSRLLSSTANEGPPWRAPPHVWPMGYTISPRYLARVQLAVVSMCVLADISISSVGEGVNSPLFSLEALGKRNYIETLRGVRER